MEKEILTFNDLPQVVAHLRDEVMGMRAMLSIITIAIEITFYVYFHWIQ